MNNRTEILLLLPFSSGALFTRNVVHNSIGTYKVIVLDNGAFHKANKLVIPDNIALVFLPPYCPELNPAEKMWAKFKRNFTNRLFKSLDSLSDYLESLCVSVTPKEVQSICAFNYIFSDNFWTII